MHKNKIRIFCHNCKKKSSINHKEEKANDLLKDHLNRNSYRIIENEKGINKKSACIVVNQTTEELIPSNDLTRLLKPQNYSGILLVDRKYVPVKETSDETMGQIAQVAREVFPDVIIQICLTHYSKTIERTFIANSAIVWGLFFLTFR